MLLGAMQESVETAEDNTHPAKASDAPSSAQAIEIPANAEETDEDDLSDVPSDTLAAVLLLRSQFPYGWSRDVPPLVLRSQIYSIVMDRTIVDRQLDELRCAAQPQLLLLCTDLLKWA